MNRLWYGILFVTGMWQSSNFAAAFLAKILGDSAAAEEKEATALSRLPHNDKKRIRYAAEVEANLSLQRGIQKASSTIPVKHITILSKQFAFVHCSASKKKMWSFMLESTQRKTQGLSVVEGNPHKIGSYYTEQDLQSCQQYLILPQANEVEGITPLFEGDGVLTDKKAQKYLQLLLTLYYGKSMKGFKICAQSLVAASDNEPYRESLFGLYYPARKELIIGYHRFKLPEAELYKGLRSTQQKAVDDLFV